MMAWIEFHPATIKRLQKFRDLKAELGWSVNETLGWLGNFWGQVIELREDGNIHGWKPEYVAELTDVKLAPERLWAALVRHGWVEPAGEKVLLHDWLDYAERYLKARYRSKNPARLRAIYALHGRAFSEGEPLGNDPGTTQVRPRALVGLGDGDEPVDLSFKSFWTAYPRKEAKAAALKVWKRLAPTPELLTAILAALERFKASSQWTKDDGQFVPHATTWLNQKRWEDDAPPPARGGAMRPAAAEGKYAHLEEVV